MGFTGLYESTLDAKKRFLLPAALKKQFEDGGNKFVISCGLDNCLNIYPLKSWEIIEVGLKALKDSDPNVRDFKAVFLGGTFDVELDSAGRAMLNPVLVEHAGLDKDIILAPYVDKIKIWDAKKYAEMIKKAKAKTFTELALNAGVEI